MISSYAQSFDFDSQESFVIRGKASGFNYIDKSFKIENSDERKVIFLGDNTKLIANGAIASFDKIEFLSEYKNITAAYLKEKNIVYISSKPVAEMGTVKDIMPFSDGFLIDIYKDGLVKSYYSQNGDFTIGDNVRYISDGYIIIEVNKI